MAQFFEQLWQGSKRRSSLAPEMAHTVIPVVSADEVDDDTRQQHHTHHHGHHHHHHHHHDHHHLRKRKPHHGHHHEHHSYFGDAQRIYDVFPKEEIPEELINSRSQSPADSKVKEGDVPAVISPGLQPRPSSARAGDKKISVLDHYLRRRSLHQVEPQPTEPDDTFLDDDEAKSEIPKVEKLPSQDGDGIFNTFNAFFQGRARKVTKQEMKILQTNAHGKPYPVRIRSEIHRITFDFADSKSFSAFILIIILINTVMLIASTDNTVNVRAGWYFAAIDAVFLGIYIMEILVKLYAWRKAFWKNAWNVMDFLIVISNSADFVSPLVVQNLGGFNGAAIFRILRIFRAVRAIRALRVLRTIR